MKNNAPAFGKVIKWRAFYIAWFLLAAVIAAAAIALVEISGPIGFAEAGVLAAIFVLTFFALYRASERDLEATADRGELKSILIGVEDALIVYDTDFKVNFFNAVAERVFELPAAGVVGHALSPRDIEREGWKTLAQVMFPTLAPRVLPKNDENAIPQIMDISLSDPEREFRVSTAPVMDETGKTIAFIKIIRDRTSQISAIRSKDEFITVASHQLRGPVTDINWALQSLAQASELTDTNKMIVETAAAASDNLLRRIEDLLNIAKIEDGRAGYLFEPADIVEFLGKILADVLPAARKANVKIYFDRPEEEIPRVMIDSRQLSMAVVNLLENAIRYNVENGEVTVKVSRLQDKPYVVVAVKDTGIGVPPEALNKLFTKFYRADNAEKAQTEGSGLGLYLAKGIIQGHGGQIWAESELKRGTTISFTLPTDPDLVPRREVSIADTL